MKLAGLIGFPLSHSFSKKYFNEKFLKENIEGWDYSLFPVEKISKVTDVLHENENLIGLNVTIPYKQNILEFVDDLNIDAEEIGAVNTLKIFRDGNYVKIAGYNTDWLGFYNSLYPYLENHHEKALIFGTGGSAKAVAFALRKLGIDYDFVSRALSDGVFTYSGLRDSILDEAKIWINCTPLGMYPESHFFPPVNYKRVTDSHLLYDLIYNPEETLFLTHGIIRGATVVNGFQMLKNQADYSFRIWSEDE